MMPMKTKNMLLSLALVSQFSAAEPTEQQDASLTIPHLGAQPGEKVLVERFNQLDLVGSDDLPYPTDLSEPLHLSQVPEVFTRPDFELLLLDYIAQPISQPSLNRLTKSIRLYLAGEGAPYSLVYLPEQDITDGRVRVVVKPTRINAIEVQGNQYFDSQSYLKDLPLKAGDILDTQDLQPAIESLNSSDYRNVSIKLRRGTEPGTTDLILLTQEQKPWQVFVGYNDSGSLATDEDRLTTGFSLGHLFGTDHQFSMQWSSDPQAQYSRSLSFNYQLPLDATRNLSFIGSYSESEAQVPEPMEMQGKSWQVGARMDWSLPNVGQFQQNLEMALDFKASDNNLDFILPPFTIAVTDNLTEILQFGLTYGLVLPDSYGYTQGSINLILSPGGLTHHNQDDDFAATRAGAESDYLYARLDILRAISLNAIVDGLSWQLKGAYQQASGNLLGSERFSAGGQGTVRGYEQGEVIGDEGLLLSQELKLPPFSVAQWLGYGQQDQLGFYLFQDFARTWNVEPLQGERAFKLHSLGAGLRYYYGRNLSAHLAYGWQQRQSGSSDSGDRQRLNLNFRFSY